MPAASASPRPRPKNTTGLLSTRLYNARLSNGGPSVHGFTATNLASRVLEALAKESFAIVGSDFVLYNIWPFCLD